MDNRRGFPRVGVILGIVVAAALVWSTFTVFWLWRHQERVVFQPPGIAPDAPAPAVRVDFPAADGHALFGYLVSPQRANQSPRTVVIAFHGNADLSAWRVPWARELADRASVAIFLPEYRGYGGIPGVPTYLTAQSDAAGAFAYVRRAFPAARVVLHGHSLGSAIATELAATMDPGPTALILESPFTSARDMATRMLVPPIPGLWGRISRVHYDTRAKMATLDVPVSVAHGTRDVVIPVRMGRAVFGGARRRGALLIVEGAGHNDVADIGGARYWDWITAAILATIVELEEKGHGRLPGLV